MFTPVAAFRSFRERAVKEKVRGKSQDRWDRPVTWNLKVGRGISSRGRCSLEL